MFSSEPEAVSSEYLRTYSCAVAECLLDIRWLAPWLKQRRHAIVCTRTYV
jgi:hypothetical protein